MGHSWRTAESGARWLIVLWLMQYWSKELWICISWISQTKQYLDSWLSELLQSELKIKLLEVEGGHVPQCPIAGDAMSATYCGRSHAKDSSIEVFLYYGSIRLHGGLEVTSNTLSFTSCHHRRASLQILIGSASLFFVNSRLQGKLYNRLFQFG